MAPTVVVARIAITYPNNTANTNASNHISSIQFQTQGVTGEGVRETVEEDYFARLGDSGYNLGQTDRKKVEQDV